MKIMKKAIALIMIVVTFLTVIPNSEVQAAGYKHTSTIKKSTYYYKGKLCGKAAYKYVKIKGKKKGIKKANQYSRKKVARFVKYWRNSKKSMRSYYEYIDYPFEFTMSMVVKTANKKLISIAYHDYSYEGGIHGYGGTLGATFDTKSGKKLKLSDVVSGSGSEIKYKILNKYYEWNANRGYVGFDDATDTIINRKIKDFDFYVKGKYAYVIFNPYDITPYCEGIVKLRIRTKY